MLLELADAGEAAGPLADLGTGSGVLAIAPRSSAGRRWSAVDSEPAAIEAAAENAAANGVELELERLNLREQPPPAAPTVVANLTAPLLEAVAERLDGAAARPWSARACSRPRSSGSRAALGAAGLDGRVAARPRATGRRCWLAPTSGIPTGDRE